MLKMSKRCIPEGKRKELIRLADAGYTYLSIAEHLKINRNTVSRVVRRERNQEHENQQQLLNSILKRTSNKTH